MKKIIIRISLRVITKICKTNPTKLIKNFNIKKSGTVVIRKHVLKYQISFKIIISY